MAISIVLRFFNPEQDSESRDPAIQFKALRVDKVPASTDISKAFFGENTSQHWVQVTHVRFLVEAPQKNGIYVSIYIYIYRYRYSEKTGGMTY